MTEIIELEDSVFEAVVSPDDPGCIRRRLVIRQLSGRPLDDDEWEEAVLAIAAQLIERGAKMHSFSIECAGRPTPEPIKNAHVCSWLCRVRCWLKLHRWDSPGGDCICCGVHDDFFDE